MAGLNSIGKRLEHYESQLEAWKEPHDEVMRNHDNAEALGEDANFGVYLYERLRSFEARTFEEASGLYAGYLNWHRQTLCLIRAIEQSERRGFDVQGSDKLREAFRCVNAIADRISGRVTALDFFVNGQGVSEEDFLNSL